MPDISSRNRGCGVAVPHLAMRRRSAPTYKSADMTQAAGCCP